MSLKVKVSEQVVSQLQDVEGIDNIFVKEEGTDFYRFDGDALYRSMSPAAQHNHDRRMKAFKVQMWMNRHLPWMDWPILKVVYTFWFLIMDEGIKSNIESKFDGIQFSYLNDSMKPSVWHTWRSITHSHAKDKFTGIYVGGAPKSYAQAIEWEKGFEAKRKEKELAKDRSL